MIIYKITNLINGKVYIGKTSKNIEYRFKKHIKNANKKINRYLYDSINKYGIENFTIEEIEKTSTELINEREIFWINYYKSNQKEFGYNMTSGGDGGNTGKYHTCGPYYFWVKKYGIEKANEIKELQKKRSSEVNKTRIRKPMDQNFKDKRSKYCIENNIKPPIMIGENHPRYGKKIPHSEETKKKLSDAKLGKTYEDVYGYEKAAKLKQQLKNSFVGDRNPKYVNFSKDQKKLAISILINEKLHMDNICKIINISPYKFRLWIRSEGITNYQKIYQKTSFEEWSYIWSNINVD